MNTLSQHLSVDLTDTAKLSPYIFGCNLEHTRACINGGLSAQMLRNRKFAGKPSKNEGCAADWFSIGTKHSHFHLVTPYDPNKTNESYVYTRHYCPNAMPRINELQAQIVQNLTQGQPCGIGQHEIALQAQKTYELRVIAKCNVPVTLQISLTDRKGTVVYASQTATLVPGDWNLCEFTLTPDQDDTDGCIRFTWTEYARIIFGALSMMPEGHFHGMRRDVIDCLKEMGVSLLRWPGGNFAGEYRWQDGLLPADMRAPLQAYTEIETQPYTHGYDYHEIGINEFIALCKEVGADPFITINPVWNTPEENAAWVEYCNGSAETAYGKIRAQQGYPEPYHVKFWSLGNEMGYGHMEGSSVPGTYAALARLQADAMLAVDPTLNICSSGPYPNQDWATDSANALADVAQYVSLHHYANCELDYSSPEAIKQTCEDIFASPAEFQSRIHQLRAMLDDKIHISFDEWNRWYAWYRPSCTADGIFAARMLHMFMQESLLSDVPVCCYFQPVGEGAIEIKPYHSFLTGIGQAFSLLAAHKGQKLCRLDGIQDLEAAATVHENILTVTLINTSLDQPKTFSLHVCGEPVETSCLQPEHLLPHSRFKQEALDVTVQKEQIKATLPPHSIAKISIRVP